VLGSPEVEVAKTGVSRRRGSIRIILHGIHGLVVETPGRAELFLVCYAGDLPDIVR